MKTFVIDSANCAKVYASSEKARKSGGAIRFATEKELRSATRDWPMSRLVAIWNQLPGIRPVRKFRDRSTALRRIWRVLQVPVPKSGTKIELVIALLQQPSGATLQEIMAATGWQPHSVRCFISAQLSKRLGFRVKSFEREGERVYQIRPKAL